MITCTTFPDDAWDLYAREFVESYVKYWPYTLHAYVDKRPDFDHERVVWHEGFSCRPEIVRFREKAPKNPKSYLYDAGRFCFKVFAQLDAAQFDKHVIWLDADIVTFAPPDTEWLEQANKKWPLVYLGRKGGHTETGFLMFNHNFPVMADFRKTYRDLYENFLIFRLKYWTDCHAFDYAKSGIGALNLSPTGKGIEHVFVASRLGAWMDHKKGNRKHTGFSPEHPRSRLCTVSS